MGLITKSNGENMLDIHNFYVGDRYALALSLALKVWNNTKVINFDMNNLTDDGAIALIESICPDTEEVNLSNNPDISIETYQILV